MRVRWHREKEESGRKRYPARHRGSWHRAVASSAGLGVATTGATQRRCDTMLRSATRARTRGAGGDVMTRTARVLVNRGLGFMTGLLLAVPTAVAHAQGLPSRLTDQQFWKLVTESSEAGGFFQS